MENQNFSGKRSILYYPNIYVDSTWLREVLLYWDEVTSIVPFDLNDMSYDDNDFNQELLWLKKEGVYRELKPEFLFNNEYLNSDFEREVSSRIIPIARRRYSKKCTISARTIVKDNKLKVNKNTYNMELDGQPVHSGKIGYALIKILEKYGNINTYDEWYYIDKVIADRYMSILAKYMAIADRRYTGNNTIIGSSKPYEHYAYNIRTNETKCSDIYVEQHLKGILPVPKNDASFDDILNFKKECRNELLKFRLEITNMQNDISNNPDRLESIITGYKERIEIETNEIVKASRDYKVNMRLSSTKECVKISKQAINLVGNLIPQVKPIGLALQAAESGLDLKLKSLSRTWIKSEDINKNFLYITEGIDRGILDYI